MYLAAIKLVVGCAEQLTCHLKDTYVHSSSVYIVTLYVFVTAGIACNIARPAIIGFYDVIVNTRRCHSCLIYCCAHYVCYSFSKSSADECGYIKDYGAAEDYVVL